jgi:DNA-binding CsgD family transcriptional regulator
LTNIKLRLEIVLSDREIEVLDYLGTCLSYKQIAVKLKIAESTVKCHASSIFKKLNIHDRYEAAMIKVALYEDARMNVVVGIHNKLPLLNELEDNEATKLRTKQKILQFKIMLKEEET